MNVATMPSVNINGWMTPLDFFYILLSLSRTSLGNTVTVTTTPTLIFLSDVGILVVMYLLYHLAMAKGLTWVLCIYGVPLFFVNSSLVCVTYLQHTHPSLPHYDSTEWDWLRGALATVDRDYGILNRLGHNIVNTHVTHHLFPKMPHYHAMEATKAIKPILKDYYKFDNTPILKALYREAKECVYIESDDNEEAKGVFWFGNEF
ncbi:hypothetical protein L1887_11730 [Cichorium endivia]|nr:hypothetical protein L1887_11730 [Cichorium endivia]